MPKKGWGAAIPDFEIPEDMLRRRVENIKLFYAEIKKLKDIVVQLEKRRDDIKAEIEQEYKSYIQDLGTQKEANEKYNQRLQEWDVNLVAREKALTAKEKDFEAQKKLKEAEFKEKDRTLKVRQETLDTDIAKNSNTGARLSKWSEANENEGRRLIQERADLNEWRLELEALKVSQAEQGAAQEKKLNETLDAITVLAEKQKKCDADIQTLRDLQTSTQADLVQLVKQREAFLKEQAEFKKAQEAADLQFQNNVKLKAELLEKEAYLNDFSRVQALERRQLDGKIKLIQRLRKGEK